MADPDAAALSSARELVDYWTPLVLRMLVEAGVVQAFGHSARSPADVAAATGVDASTLARMIRALTSRGVFERAGTEAVRLSPVGRLFLSGEPGSLGGLATFKPYELHAWAEATGTLRSGRPAFPEHYGADYWSWMAANPQQSAHFNDTMRRRTSSLLDVAMPLFDWPKRGTAVDLGGGNGLLIERLLRVSPMARGVVFDLPDVAAEAQDMMQRAGLSDRVECIGGDLFESVPEGHELYVMASVLHDWSDGDATKILQTVRRAMPVTSRLLLFESVLADDDEPDLAKLLDLHMLVLLGAGERTREQWSDLLRASGFELVRVVPTPGLSWIEARPMLVDEHHDSIVRAQPSGSPRREPPAPQ